MPKVGWPELAIILAVVIAIFGVGKIAGLGKALGQSIREFKKAKSEGDMEMKQAVASPGDACDVQTGTKA